jgi:hypothetical protein
MRGTVPAFLHSVTPKPVNNAKPSEHRTVQLAALHVWASRRVSPSTGFTVK